MTTAHRPTWQQAMGGESQGGNRMAATGKQSARDIPGHKSLKTRHHTSSSFSRKSDARRTLDDRESLHKHKQQRLNTLTSSAASSRSAESAAQPALEDNAFPEDADDDGPAAAVGGSSDEEDEEAELRRELEAIKQERLEDERKKKLEYDKEHEDETRDKILRGNPLLTNQPVTSEGTDDSGEMSVGIGRAWDDDVVFKNQTKGKLKQKKTFINDAVRSDFHKKFMTKYIV
eukprot:GHVS01058320.1.p1 GENE.GHVS01058320.1~~GHVS01058320.1.p1  ORF type:complete len:231 (+),score=52.45 GHVS01058320.1:89-781(+)